MRETYRSAERGGDEKGGRQRRTEAERLTALVRLLSVSVVLSGHTR